ncbi:MAG TPA: ester cyclase [Acidimicrobiales bacterium]|nr:ester cyclase [Acidimicrobiales bacterium]
MADDAANFLRVPLEIFNEGRTDLIDELFAEDYVEHTAPPGFPATRDGLHTWLGALLAAFPDFRYEVQGQWQDGDHHVGHLRASGTMTGDFAGMAASNKSATWEEIHIGRFSGGKLVEHWGAIDRLGMLTQLGFAPPMG